MTPGRYYGTVVPLAAIIYVIVLFAVDFDSKAVIIGALIIAAISFLGSTLSRGGGGRNRNRDRGRNRKGL